METILLNINISADKASPKTLRKHLNKVLTSLDVHIQTSRKVELVTSEIVTNIVTHNNDNHTNITLKFGKCKNGYWLDIYDNGAEFDPLSGDIPVLDDEFLLFESSRGLYLIRSQCDFIEYEYLNKIKNNRIHCVWYDENINAGPTILIIDDSEIELAIVSNLLSDQFSVLQASNGLPAPRIARAIWMR